LGGTVYIRAGIPRFDSFFYGGVPFFVKSGQRPVLNDKGRDTGRTFEEGQGCGNACGIRAVRIAAA
jgi:hypothetical protein